MEKTEIVNPPCSWFYLRTILTTQFVTLAYLRWARYVLLGVLGDIIVQYNRVESPSLVRPCHLLPHSRQESLRIEEPSHPEDMWPTMEDPREKLTVAFDKLSEPEAESG